MKKQKSVNKRSLLIIFSVVSLLIVVLGFYGWKRSNIVDEQTVNKYEEDLLLSNDLYDDDYAFNKNKSSTDIYYSFSDSQYEEDIFGFLNYFNTLSVDLSQVQKEYEEFESSSLYAVKLIDANQSAAQFNLEDSKEVGLEEKVSSYITKDYQYINEDILLEEDEFPDGPKGYIDRKYLETYDATSILNTGLHMRGVWSRDDLVTSIQANTNLVIENSDESSQVGVDIIPFNQFLELVASGDARIYEINKIEQFSRIFPVHGFEIEPSKGQISIKDLSVGYFYIEETNMLLPLIKLEGTFISEEGESKIVFWVNALDI